jgi:hypothetical protein
VVKILHITIVLYMLVSPSIAAEHHHEDRDAYDGHAGCAICQLAHVMHGADVTQPPDYIEAPVTARCPADFSPISSDYLPPTFVHTRSPPRILL